MAKQAHFARDFDFFGPERRFCIAYQAGFSGRIPDDHFRAAEQAGALHGQDAGVGHAQEKALGNAGSRQEAAIAGD